MTICPCVQQCRLEVLRRSVWVTQNALRHLRRGRHQLKFFQPAASGDDAGMCAHVLGARKKAQACGGRQASPLRRVLLQSTARHSAPSTPGVVRQLGRRSARCGARHAKANGRHHQCRLYHTATTRDIQHLTTDENQATFSGLHNDECSRRSCSPSAKVPRTYGLTPCLREACSSYTCMSVRRREYVGAPPSSPHLCS